MPSFTFRRVAAALLLTAVISSFAPTAAQARGLLGRVSVEGPAREPRERGLLPWLLRLFDFAGGAMDPNGNR